MNSKIAIAALAVLACLSAEPKDYVSKAAKQRLRRISEQRVLESWRDDGEYRVYNYRDHGTNYAKRVKKFNVVGKVLTNTYETAVSELKVKAGLYDKLDKLCKEAKKDAKELSKAIDTLEKAKSKSSDKVAALYDEVLALLRKAL